MINSSMNGLINATNNQFTINKSINSRFINMTHKTNEIIKKISATEVIQEIKEFKISNSLKVIDYFIRDVQDAIVGAKRSLPSSHLLLIEELVTIKDLMEK